MQSLLLGAVLEATCAFVVSFPLAAWLKIVSIDHHFIGWHSRVPHPSGPQGGSQYHYADATE